MLGRTDSGGFPSAERRLDPGVRRGAIEFQDARLCLRQEALAPFWAAALGYVILADVGNYVALLPDGVSRRSVRS